jgi:hypothetical protein
MGKLTSLLILLSLILSSCTQKAGQPEWQKKYNDPKIVRRMFDNPPMFYAPHTFWFWDDSIKPGIIASMAQEMCRQGLNPGYAHGRGEDYLPYPYLPKEEWLSDKWFSAFGLSLGEAEKSGMTLGFCDEYWWPSGQAAGRVLQQHPELEAQYLDWKRYEVKSNTIFTNDSADFAVAARLTDKMIDQSSLVIIGEEKKISWKVPDGNWVVYTYTIKHHPGFDGGKVNYLNPGLMKAFIPMVYEKYQAHFGDKLGHSIPGTFVDNEGDFGWRMAWSDYLAEQYKAAKNRDIRLWLPLLTEKDRDGVYAKARCDWYDAISDAYISCYFRPSIQWLKEHNMYCISNLWEESIQLQSQAMGDFMRVTREATMPGTDCLEMKSQDVHDFKEVQSVGEFEDRPVMSEIMGVAGWNQTPAMMKKTVNSVTAFGVTHIVPHGINVNRNIATIPFPADWFTENPYWNYLHLWTDFSRRASFVNRQGQLLPDVLLINPLESAFALSDSYFSDEYTQKWDPVVNKINDVYSEAMRSLTKNNIDFLIADKYYIDRGTTSIQGESCKFSINNHDFKAIVVPPMFLISRKVSERLLEFAEKGGKVIMLGMIPGGSPEEGANDDLIVKQMEKLLSLPSVIRAGDYKEPLQMMVENLKNDMIPGIKVINENLKLYTAARKIGNSFFYWIANNNDNKVTAELLLRDGKGLAEKWNCETGDIHPVSYEVTESGARVTLEMEACEGFWLVFNPDKKPVSRNISVAQSTWIPVEGKWSVKLVSSDTIYASSAKGLFTAERKIDLKRISTDYVMDTTWKYLPFVVNAKDEYPAVTKKSTGGVVYWRMPVPVGAVRMIFDDRFRKGDVWIDGIKTELKNNELNLPSAASVIAWTWSGNAIKDRLSSPLKFICSSKAERDPGSWYDYGLLQYSGYVDYEKKVDLKDLNGSVKLDLGKVKYMAEVWVNGVKAGESLWGPYTFDISRLVRKGENVLRIRVGNLIASRMWITSDLGHLRMWGWRGAPDMNDLDGGLFGPVKIVVKK